METPSLPSQVNRGACATWLTKEFGLWQVFYRENLRKHGLTKSDVSVSLDMSILQQDVQYENCYVFTHLHIQEFFAAVFYMLKGSWGTKDHSFQSLEGLKLLLESNS